MKQINYIYILLFLLLFSCQDNNENGIINDSSVLQFTVDLHEYKSITRAVNENEINDIHLLVFDANGLFLQHVQAFQVTDNNGTGTFKAEISEAGRIIHFIANYDNWDSFDEITSQQKDERELLPEFSGSNMVFWGRNTISQATIPINVTLYRNQAKVTVENKTTNFQVTGYALSNFITTGTAAPFNPQTTTSPFIITDNLPTIPLGMVNRGSQTEDECNLDDKYMFENENLYNNQAFVIIKGRLNGSGEELYYKIQLLNVIKQPYPIIRNYHYRIVINVFSEEANGSNTFEDAKNAEASNNIYAEISQESPTIADTENNILTVGSTNYLFINGGNLNIPAHYTKNGIPSDTEINVYILEDQGNILHAIQYDQDGMIRGYISIVPAGQQEATILVTAGALSRTITIISSAYYLFNPMTITPKLYNDIDDPVELSFYIPNNIPNYLYPLKCAITTKKLYPVEPNKNLQVEIENGSYKYIYWATSPGVKNLNFKTSLHDSDEYIYIENKYFLKDSVKLESRRFANASINGNNIVNYGANSIAQLTFDIVDASIPAQYPLTVHIATNNLKTSTSGWIAETGGYYQVYNIPPTGTQTVLFSSKVAVSKEEVVISATGFNSKTINMDNVLSTNQRLTGHIYVNYGTGNLTLGTNARITSSDTSVVPSFRTGTGSSYSITVQNGAHLSDVITLTYSSYNATLTVEQLLENNVIILTP